VIWPWANQQTRTEGPLRQRGDLERITPGQFQESANGARVFFLDKDTPDNKSGKNIFISTVDRGKEAVTSARSGRIDTIDAMGDSQFLLLSNGQRLENIAQGRAEGQRIRGVRHPHRQQGAGDVLTPWRREARSTMDLLREPTP
jgi:lipopolysaccharide export system permease protein